MAGIAFVGAMPFAAGIMLVGSMSFAQDLAQELPHISDTRRSFVINPMLGSIMDTDMSSVQKCSNFRYGRS